MLSQGVDKDTIYSYRLSIKNYLFPICPPDTESDKAFTQTNIDLFRANLMSKELSTRTINIKLNVVEKLITLKIQIKHKHSKRKAVKQSLMKISIETTFLTKV